MGHSCTAGCTTPASIWFRSSRVSSIPVIAPSVSSSRVTSPCALSPVTLRASSPCNSASVCSGWRRSWLAAARKRDLARLAASAACLASSTAAAACLRRVMSLKVITTPSTPLLLPFCRQGPSVR